VEVLGDVAIVLYELEMSGLLVYQYRFEGSRWVRSARCTAVLKKEEGVWRIAHEHFSAPYPTRSST
jgi:ketosteroid isomerase-like protein